MLFYIDIVAVVANFILKYKDKKRTETKKKLKRKLSTKIEKNKKKRMKENKRNEFVY